MTAAPPGTDTSSEAVREPNVIPTQVLAEAGTKDPMELAKLGVAAAMEERWRTALVLLAEAYTSFAAEPVDTEAILRADPSEGRERAVRIETGTVEPPARQQARWRMFSHYGLALAMSDRSRLQEGAHFCEIAIQKEPYQAEHYALLARIWKAGNNRLKTVQAIDRGLKEVPNSQILLELRGEIGWREKNAVGFLPRDHPINVSLGKMLRKKRERAKNGGQPNTPAPAPAKPKT